MAITKYQLLIAIEFDAVAARDAAYTKLRTYLVNNKTNDGMTSVERAQETI